MTTWIEPPPQEKGMGCLGKGCLLIIAFLVFLLIAFVIGFYVGTKPKEIPQVQTSDEEQNAVRARWDEFEATARNEQIVSPEPSIPDPTAAADATPVAVATPASGNRIELSAGDINQLISRGRHTRGRAFVTIDNDVARVQLTVPLEKLGFKGRSLNGSFAVRSSPDHSPQNLQISEMSFAGVPDAMLNTLKGAYPVQGYVSDFVNTHGITSCTIENGKVILETSGSGR